MFEAFSIPILILLFVIAAGVVWLAGIWLSNSTDALSTRYGFGQAMGGVILLALGTNLPEIAITSSAALHHNIGVAIGNILGGIAIQTVVLVILDFALQGIQPLSYRAASLTLVLEGAIVIGTLSVAIMGTRLAPGLIFAHVTPQNLAILIVWLGGLYLLQTRGRNLPWHAQGKAPDSQEKPAGHSQKEKSDTAGSSAVVFGKFGISALGTLAAGVVLELSGDAIAKKVGMSGVIFGATFLAASTSIPEVSTGLASIRLGDYQLAASDIFGGNAFLPVLFLVASVISGQSVLPYAQNTDVYLASLGIVLTAIYVVGFIARPPRRLARLGLDSWLVLIAYAIGIAGLFYVHNHA